MLRFFVFVFSGLCHHSKLSTSKHTIDNKDSTKQCSHIPGIPLSKNSQFRIKQWKYSVKFSPMLLNPLGLTLVYYAKLSNILEKSFLPYIESVTSIRMGASVSLLTVILPLFMTIQNWIIIQTRQPYYCRGIIEIRIRWVRKTPMCCINAWYVVLCGSQWGKELSVFSYSLDNW